MRLRSLILVLSLVFLEWLDFSLYLYLAKSLFAKIFFPPSSHGVLLSFALFAAAYFARPLGGYWFGRRADSSGRRKPMVWSAALMGLSTLAMCLLPSYATIGVASSWLLLVCRLAQGLALGGEINTSAMFLIEHKHDNPLFSGSLVAASGALGMFVGGVFASLLHDAGETWRFVFALLGVVSLLVCQRRKQLFESQEFLEASREIFPWRHYWPNLFRIAAIGGFVSVTVYICNVFWVAFAIDKGLWSPTVIAWLGAMAQLISALFAMALAYFISDNQVYRLMKASLLMVMLAAPTLFYFTAQMNRQGVLFALMGYVITNGLLCSSLFYFLYLQLPTQYRCQGISTVWGVAACTGAIALPLAAHFVSLGVIWLPGALPVFFALLALWRLSPLVDSPPLNLVKNAKFS